MNQSNVIAGEVYFKTFSMSPWP